MFRISYTFTFSADPGMDRLSPMSLSCDSGFDSMSSRNTNKTATVAEHQEVSPVHVHACTRFNLNCSIAHILQQSQKISPSTAAMVVLEPALPQATETSDVKQDPFELKIGRSQYFYYYFIFKLWTVNSVLTLQKPRSLLKPVRQVLTPCPCWSQ